MRRNFRFAAALILSVFLIASCAGLQRAETPIQSYAKALGIWVDSATQFKLYYEITDEATQAKWDEEFKPVLVRSKEILDIWKMRLDIGQTTADQMEQWKLLKNELLVYLATNM